MLGAIYGDKAGSIYEYNQLKEIKAINPDKLITSSSFYSDDTILTVAIIDAIINCKDYERVLRDYVLKYENYKPNYAPYFKTAFSPGTIKWAKKMKVANSVGNGAMMRISPVGYLFDNIHDVVENARLATIPSHNSKEAIDSATIIALLIYYFRKGLTKEEAFKRLDLQIKYEPFLKFNTTCYETLGNCLYAIYNSVSFQDAIRKTLLMGGDTDTNACIVASVAEAMYGMSLEEKRDSLNNLPIEFQNILKRVYK